MEAISDWHLAQLLTVIWEIGPKWLQWSGNNASPDIRLPSREPREGCCLLYTPLSCCYDKNAMIKENYRRVYLGLHSRGIRVRGGGWLGSRLQVCQLGQKAERFSLPRQA